MLNCTKKKSNVHAMLSKGRLDRYLLVFRILCLLQPTAATIAARTATDPTSNTTATTEAAIIGTEPSLSTVVVLLVVPFSLSPLPLIMLPLPLMSLPAGVVTHTGRLNVPGPIVTAATCMQ